MKAGEFIVWSTYYIFAIAEKKHVAVAAENINVNVIMPPQSSVILTADISQCWLIVSGKAGLLLIGSPASDDPTACTHVNHRVNCCVKSFLRPLVNLKSDSSHRNRLDSFRSHLHVQQPILELQLLWTSGLTFLLFLIHVASCVGFAPSLAPIYVFICLASLRICAVSL